MSTTSRWKKVPVGSIAEVITGRTPPTGEGRFWGGSIPFITPGDLKGSFIHEAERTITEEGLKVCRGLPRETVLVSCIGYIGKVGIVDSPVAVTNQQVNAVIPRQGEADSQFLAYAFMHLEPYLSNLAGVTTVPILNKSNFEAALIPLPPLPEQRAIAHVLRAAQAAREARQREASLERERKAALMAHLFTHGTRGEPTKQTPIGEMPVSWGVVQVGSLGEIITGTTPSTSHPEYYDGPYMFISPGDIGDGKYVEHTQKHLSEQGLSIVRVLPKDTALVVCIGATIGKTALTTQTKSATNQQINAVIAGKSVTPDFLYFTLSFHAHRLPSLAGRAAVPIVNKSNFADFSVSLPRDIEEQRAVAEALSACDAKIAALQRESTLLDELFRALLEELMTGRVSVAGFVER